MDYNMKIGGIGFHIVSPGEIAGEDIFAPFMISGGSKGDVEIEISANYEIAPPPVVSMTGDDLLIEYYVEEKEVICLAKGGKRGYLSNTVCNKTFTHMTCYINFQQTSSFFSFHNLIRLIPMRTILLYHGVLFFHASQIVINHKGILFAAPSGTGKTTQAKLWKNHRDAKIVCNDRTLVRNKLTYGYPVDGSEPVISGEVHSLGAVVVLSQSPENRIRRLKPSAALANLMPQLVIDRWNTEAWQLAMEQLLNMIMYVPVYALCCTPDEAAVSCLEQQLKKDGCFRIEEDGVV